MGGLLFGDRVLSESSGLIYANLGAFFARAGFITVVADYRLTPPEKGGATYPDCLIDTRDALSFLLLRDHPSNPTPPQTPSSTRLSITYLQKADTTRCFLFGHSAGAMNQSSLLLNPSLLPLTHPLRPLIRGCILSGGCYHFDSVYSGMPLTDYFGPTASLAHIHNSSLGLLQSAPQEVVAALPNLFIISGEWEADGLKVMVRDFVGELRRRGVRMEAAQEARLGARISSNKKEASLESEEVLDNGKEKLTNRNRRGRHRAKEKGPTVRVWVNKGHNHVSSYMALMSGEGEEWGYEVIRWMKERL